MSVAPVTHVRGSSHPCPWLQSPMSVAPVTHVRVVPSIAINISCGVDERRTWRHVTLVMNQGNVTLICDGQEVDFSAEPGKNFSRSSSLSFNASDTLKAVVITGVQMSSSVMTLEEIGKFSSTCNRKLVDNGLIVHEVDESLITPSNCDDVNGCESDTCGQHGYCVDGVGQMICICDEPWYGLHCENILDFCHDSKCHEESVCVSEVELKKYTCQCNKGRKGTLCQEVAVNGMWSEWEPWGACNTSCGEGQRSRQRVCDNPPPDPEGENCPGSNLEDETCNGTHCPVKYGEWAEWSVWSCSVTCGFGVSSRTRQCVSLTQEDGGRCHGDADQHTHCNMSVCPVDGQFGQWSQWSQCSETCGGGKMSRERKCDSPVPSHGGLECNMTEALEIMSCNKVVCPVCPSLTAKGQILSCSNDTNGTLAYCNISCSKGYELASPEQSQTSCGLVTNYTWSHQNRKNPHGNLPTCSPAKVPSQSSVTTRVLIRKTKKSANDLKSQKSVADAIKKKNICPQNLTYNCSLEVKVNSPTNKTRTKRSVDLVYVVVTLELELGDDNKEQDKALERFNEFEKAAVRLLNNSEEIFQLTVDGVLLQGRVESVQAEVTCQDGTGFYNGFCVDCPAGSYSVGNGSCFQCQKGFYQEQPRMSYCQPCPEGLTTSGDSSTLLSECQKDPPSYEDIFWWASSDEAIFLNYTLQNSKEVDNFTGPAADDNQFLDSNSFVIVMVACITAVVIIVITVVSYASLRTRNTKHHHPLASDEMSPIARDNPVYNIEDKPLGENFYSDMPVVLGFKHIYDTPSQTETDQTVSPKEAGETLLQEFVPEPLAQVELPDVSELKAVLAVNLMFEQ
ncbi:hypothetical protein Btru_013440 [Bulinus truncatus]|nr:hypothetical protein Btru_013440 [Bulinus truncatus]